jgi:hypothetical protein
MDYLIKKLGDTATLTAERLDHVFSQVESTIGNMGDTKDGALALIGMFDDLGDAAKRTELENMFGAKAVAGFMESGQLTGEMADALGGYADELLGYNE